MHENVVATRASLALIVPLVSGAGGVNANYCGSIPQWIYTNPAQASVWTRCGVSEIQARTFCGQACTWQCDNPLETCMGVHSNYCGSAYDEV